MTNSSPVYDWFQERLEIQDIADDVSSKYVPPHVNIFYCLGGITLVCFLVQFATGFAMTFYYKPTVTEAYRSVSYLMSDVSFGWLIRSVHRWSASMMVLMLILHVFRVYLTGGFKRPRELTWVTGVVMAVITVSFGVTGYSLPWDQVGYWAVKIVSGVPAAIPVVGDFMVELLGGGKVSIPKRPGEPDTTYADISRIFLDLGWRPKISIEDGVSELLRNIESWRHAPVWTPESIAEATKDWFRYLNQNDIE